MDCAINMINLTNEFEFLNLNLTKETDGIPSFKNGNRTAQTGWNAGTWTEHENEEDLI